jgi:hypothetical protein
MERELRAATAEADVVLAAAWPRRKMAVEDILKEAVKSVVGATIAEEVRAIVAEETRRALREREDELTALVRTAAASAIAEMLNVARRPTAGKPRNGLRGVSRNDGGGSI